MCLRPRSTAPRGARVLLVLAALFGGTQAAAAQGTSPEQLRRFIDQQVGGLRNLIVPSHDSELPQPRLANGQPDPLFQITEAKRYLGKMLFHDPVRTARILPEFGGQLATKQTASCASCHMGEAASKAGTLLNFAVGGEGRHYIDENGNFIPRRRPRAELPKLRSTPLFPGDALVDELPTLTDVYELAIGSPARGRKLPPPGRLLRTGRLDALDSVGRNAPGAIGAAFNNRLLLGGFAGEPDDAPGGLNPFNFPAQESVALLLLDAHRMIDFQSAELQKIPVYVKLFRDAFPAEAAQADSTGDLNMLINDITVLRATATFLRTTVTRDTAWDHFLAGDNGALTPAQRRGARLFFTSARSGGAGCYSCHSGPMLNKQVNDPDVAGVGRFVEENFYNLGLSDHPLQALNRAARRDPSFRDDGRREITGRDSDAFKFRVVTLRQLKDARFFFHNGAFTSVKDVIRYFNAGVPQDAEAGAVPTLTTRFTHPRGLSSPRGLGLSDGQIDDLADFLENALYDRAFVQCDPKSPTRMFQLSPPDFIYSVYRPDLARLGAIDGRPPSGKPQDNDDALSRRDMGLEFLDVTGQVRVTRLVGASATSAIESARRSEGRDGQPRDDDDDDDDWAGAARDERVYRVTNTSGTPIDTHLLVIARGLSYDIDLLNASGRTGSGDPYRRLFLPDGVLAPGQSVNVTFRFRLRRGTPAPRFELQLLSGQGKP